MLNSPFKIGCVHVLSLTGRVLLAGILLMTAAVRAAEQEVETLETTEMSVQVRPEVRAQLRSLALQVFSRSPEAPAARVQLQALADNGTLNYWETFEALLLVASANRIAGAYPEAQAALEKCLNFTDIDSARRREVLRAAGEFYVQRKDAEKALAVYEELSDMRGGRDSRTLMRLSQVHSMLLRDYAAAGAYAEAAIRYETGTPKRSQYNALRTAYLQMGELDKALDVAKAMVDLFDYESDADSMDQIIAAINGRAE